MKISGIAALIAAGSIGLATPALTQPPAPVQDGGYSGQGYSDQSHSDQGRGDHYADDQQDHVYPGEGGRYRKHCGGGNGAVGTVAGGVGGGLIGNALIGGPIGLIAGVLGGGLLGRHLDKANTKDENGC
jgi:hypothetical protein